MIRIAAENIYVLRNSAGKSFTDLMDRLIRSSVAVLGIPATAVLDNPRVNYPDGGVDTQVTDGRTDDGWNYFTAQTVWQYKAVALKDFTDSKVKEEITGGSKGYVRSQIQNGYAYRLCIADDGPAERKTEIKNLLDAEIRAVNPVAPEVVVLFASNVVDWVNTFPAIAAEMLGSTLTEFFHFSTWKNQERAETKTFVETQETNVIFDSVQRHLDWSKKLTTPRLTISGDAGVGKSRTVFEAIAALSDIAPLTLYMDDENNALNVARAVANYSNLYAVLVADECLDATAFQLARILQGTQHRVRLITIDNALEGSGGPELRLSRIGTTTVEKIVETNFPNIEQSRRFRYCQLSEGYLRFAIFLCNNDDLIVQQGHLGTLLSDTKSYLSTMFGKRGPFKEDDYAALMAISLVQRCGVRDNVFTELEQLCTLVHLDALDVRNRLHHMQKTNGLVGRAGRYYYVTPAPVAMVCFQAAWTRWAELAPEPFLAGFPKNLIPSFLARMSRVPEEVGNVVNAYFRNWEISRGGDIFADANETEQFLLLVRSSPDVMVPRLHQRVMAATPEQLGKRYGGGRRSLVTDANEISAFPQWFFLAEEILFALARNESEPDLGNNATKIWAALFPIMGYVATPFDERLKLLRGRLSGGDRTTKMLCITALHAALGHDSIHMISGQPYGNRIAPTPWRPKSYGELYEYMKECLAELNVLSTDEDGVVREKATAIFISSIRSMVFHGLTQQAKEGAGDLPSHVRPVLRAELNEFILLNNSEHSPHSAEEKKQRTDSVTEWVAALASVNLHDHLVEDVGTNSWEHHLEQEAWEGRIRELATHLLQNQADFEQELSWLSSDKARSSVELGAQIGRLDNGLLLLDRIVIAGLENRNPNMARGYFVGASENAQSELLPLTSNRISEKLNACLDALWNEDPVFAFQIMTLAGDTVHSFERAIAAVREKKIGAGYLNTFVAWNGQRHTWPGEARLAAETLLDLAQQGDENAASTGIEFIVFVLMRTTESEDKLEWLQRVFGDKLLDTIFGLLEHASLEGAKETHWFSQIFSRVLPANPDRATSILLQMMQNTSYEVSEVASGLFPTVAKIRPQELMEGIGKLMLFGGVNISFISRKYPIVSLPEGVVIQWLEKHGLDGARMLAGHVPGPFVGSNGPDLNPITRFILEKYGEDDKVFANWAAGMLGGQVFAGSIADYTERRAAMAEPFLNFPIEAVQRWARGQIQFAEENVSKFRLSEEEAGLF
jgi:hypothetical protein